MWTNQKDVRCLTKIDKAGLIPTFIITNTYIYIIHIVVKRGCFMNESQEKQVLSSEHEEILQWIKNVKFKKNLFGGVKESDVWKKIEELNNLYEQALIAATNRTT